MFFFKVGINLVKIFNKESGNIGTILTQHSLKNLNEWKDWRQDHDLKIIKSNRVLTCLIWNLSIMDFPGLYKKFNLVNKELRIFN